MEFKNYRVKSSVNKEESSQSEENKKIKILTVIICLFYLFLVPQFVFADGYTTNQPSHATLYADTLTSKTDGSSVNIADLQGLFVTGDIKTLGNVGIGTTSPERLLHIAGTVPSAAWGETDATVDNKKWDLSVNGEQFIGRVINDAYTTSGTWVAVDRTGTTVDSVVFPNGNIGIGTTTPQQKLHVK